MSAPALNPRAEQLLGFSRNLCRVEALLSRNSGEKFNVFRILRIQRYETRTHTPLLRELLDPKGTHGQGAAFLRLFLAECGISEAEFQLDGATVHEEYYIGQKTEETGGRIDLFLQDARGRRLGIENKIDAGEQENQLGRYKRFLEKAELIYLTLDGRPPMETPEHQADAARCISYLHEITRWLEACRKHAATAPLVRETITQYLHLVQELTHQNQDEPMSKELARAALNNPADLEAFFALCNARGEVDAQITGWLEEQLDRLAGNLGLERVNRLTNFRQRYAGFAFRNPALRQHHLQIRFEFQYGNGGGFAFGFVYEDPSQPGSFADELRRLFAEHFGKPQISAAWPAWTMWKGYETWNDALLVEIRFGGKFLQDLEERLKILTAIATQLNSESA